jgi:hypothetical protein
MASTIPGEKMVRWDVSADFSQVLPGEFVDVIYEHMSPGLFLRRGSASTSITFRTQAETAEVTRWFLLPRGKEYRSFRIVRWETGKPEKVEPVRVVNKTIPRSLPTDYCPMMLAIRMRLPCITNSGWTGPVPMALLPRQRFAF